VFDKVAPGHSIRFLPGPKRAILAFSSSLRIFVHLQFRTREIPAPYDESNSPCSRTGYAVTYEHSEHI
jgi:hypothetical protein